MLVHGNVSSEPPRQDAVQREQEEQMGAVADGALDVGLQWQSLRFGLLPGK